MKSTLVFTVDNAEEVITKITPYLANGYTYTHDWFESPTQRAYRKPSAVKSVEELSFTEYPYYTFPKSTPTLQERLGEAVIAILYSTRYNMILDIPLSSTIHFEENYFIVEEPVHKVSYTKMAGKYIAL